MVRQRQNLPTPKGLIETAKESGLEPFRYLTWVLKTAPSLDRTVDGWAEPLRNLRRMREFYRTYESAPEVLAEAMTIG